jgi:hypothetical protein
MSMITTRGHCCARVEMGLVRPITATGKAHALLRVSHTLRPVYFYIFAFIAQMILA